MIIAPAFRVSNALPVQAPAVDPTPPVPPTQPGFQAVFDFPTLVAGDRFRIARGSTANGIGIGGDARLEAISPKGATVWIKAGTFGISKEATVAVEQDSETTVKITVTEPGKTPNVVSAEIVAVRTNYSEFLSSDPALPGAATMQLDAAGRFIIDIAGGGVLLNGANLHLVLEKRVA